MDCTVHSKSIIAIHSDTTDSICLTTDNHTIASKLFCGWGTDCPAIVAAEEDYRCFHNSCEIECRMEVSLTCAAITEICDGTCVLFVHLQRVGSSNSMRELRSNRR
uniref:Pco079304 n=1 Tax=Arundo donax TaxID=35708 RepID=A0A0A9FGY8_ARUDO